MAFKIDDVRKYATENGEKIIDMTRKAPVSEE